MTVDEVETVMVRYFKGSGNGPAEAKLVIQKDLNATGQMGP